MVTNISNLRSYYVKPILISGVLGTYFGFGLACYLLVYMDTTIICSSQQSREIDCRKCNVDTEIDDIFQEQLLELEQSYQEGKYTVESSTPSQVQNITIAPSLSNNSSNIQKIQISKSPSESNKNLTKPTKANKHVKSSNNVSVLCWVTTTPKNHFSKAIHIKNTWGKRCTKLLFMSNKPEPKLPSIALPNIQEGYNWLWGKTKEALKYIYNHHLNDTDWFLKTDDDTYVIMENLRDLLKDYDPGRPYLIGYQYNPAWYYFSYMSGGAGYVISKEALKRFVEQALKMNDTKCFTSASHYSPEDIEIAKCLRSVKTTFVYPRDKRGRSKFVPIAPNPKTANMSCCSDKVISFHYIQPHVMYSMEYLIYYLNPQNSSENAV